MLQILWKMRGSNSKKMQRQLKWQLQLQNAAHSKENRQKHRSKHPKTEITIPKYYGSSPKWLNWLLFCSSRRRSWQLRSHGFEPTAKHGMATQTILKHLIKHL
jgi:hypothetical protein